MMKLLSIVLCLALIGLAPLHVLAVTLDAVTTNAGSTSTLTKSHTVTSSGSNRAIFVLCALRSLSVTLTATYAGSAMTEVRRDQSANSNISSWIFRLVSPATGTNNWVVTQTGGPVNLICYGQSATNVDPASPITDHQGQCVVSTISSSRTLTVGSNDALLDVMGLSSASQSLAQGANQTDEINPPTELSGNTTGGGSYQAGSDGGVMSWGWTNAGNGCQSVIAIKHLAAPLNVRRPLAPVEF